MNATSDIVQKLWNLCHVLRDDGISYLQYVTELTYLLFFKMMQETGRRRPSSRRATAGTTSPAAMGWSS
jgi:type I restriction-modification system DNA methylase subunit